VGSDRPGDDAGLRRRSGRQGGDLQQFIKPSAGTSIAEFTFRPAGGDRTVAKAIHLFIDMDKMIGGNFDKGLAQMKSVVEATRRDA
jgi:hypothetical protein